LPVYFCGGVSFAGNHDPIRSGSEGSPQRCANTVTGLTLGMEITHASGCRRYYQFERFRELQ
jgi:hypothetical protein